MRAMHRLVIAVVAVASLGLGACVGPGDSTATPPAATTAAPSPTMHTPAPTMPRPSPSSSSSPVPTAPAPSASESPHAPPAPPPPAPPPPAPSRPAPSPSATWTPSPSPAPSPGLPAAWRGVDLERIPTGRRVVALTFDGGSSDTAVSSILTTLERLDAPATFFVTGAFARRYPQQVRAMAAAGHPVGNHSDTHLSYPDLTDAQIRVDLAAAERAIVVASGAPARPLFRFPYGARTAGDINVVNDAGYLPIRWSVDTLGWKGTTGGITADEVVERVVGSAQPGQIVLMHVGSNPDDGTTLDADALPRIIERLRAEGYAFVDLSDLGG